MTVVLASASSPQTNMDALCEPNFGSAMLFAPVVLNALTTRAPVAQDATCSPAEVVWPRTRRNPSDLMANGFVASIRIFPFRLPAACSALCAPSQGVASTTTEASFTASPIVAARAVLQALFNNFFNFSSPGFLTPKVTVCPFLAQRAPRVPPTLPAPMIAIFIISPRYLFFDCRTATQTLTQERISTSRHCFVPSYGHGRNS